MAGPPSLSKMLDIESFRDADLLDEFLGAQLESGNLTLVLGSGVSVAFKLPNWNDLLKTLAADLKTAIPDGFGPDEIAESFLVQVGGDEVELARNVRSVLYADVDRSFDSLLGSRLLASIGALAMPSRRGSTSEIISFNFDDLLETFLGYYGVAVEAVDKMPSWNNRADIRIFHPHGLLPSDMKREVQDPIILTRAAFDKVIGNKDLWHTHLVRILTSHTCIFIGLSGADGNLSQILTEVKELHPAIKSGHPFWGVRVHIDEKEPRRAMWESRGVYQKTLSGWDELPAWLRGLCQRAAATYKVA